jgi:hypothetical protein
VLLTEDGNIWMAVCMVTLSSRKESGDVHIIMKDTQTRFDFNREVQCFEKKELKKLTSKEYEIFKIM